MLTRLFAAHRDRIVQAWIQAVDASACHGAPSAGTSGCGDPAARTIRDAAAVMYNAISGYEDPGGTPDENFGGTSGGTSGEALAPSTPGTPILRAVSAFVAWQAVQAGGPKQTCGPEQAAGCVYLFKPLLREHILPQAAEAGCLHAYLDAESRVDSLALLVFAEYTQCREHLHSVQLEAARRTQSSILRWARQHGLDTGGEE